MHETVNTVTIYVRAVLFPFVFPHVIAADTGALVQLLEMRNSRPSGLLATQCRKDWVP